MYHFSISVRRCLSSRWARWRYRQQDPTLSALLQLRHISWTNHHTGWTFSDRLQVSLWELFAWRVPETDHPPATSRPLDIVCLWPKHLPLLLSEWCCDRRGLKQSTLNTIFGVYLIHIQGPLPGAKTRMRNGQSETLRQKNPLGYNSS